MQVNTVSITFDSNSEILQIIDFLNYFIQNNQRYEETLSAFWEDDIAEEVRPRLEVARYVLHKLETAYNYFEDLT